jgi:hypothetical protein
MDVVVLFLIIHTFKNYKLKCVWVHDELNAC